MKIECLTNFLDGRDRFEKGEQRTVQPTETETGEQRGTRFVVAGWARDISGAVTVGVPHEGSTDLAIDNVSHEQTEKVGD